MWRRVLSQRAARAIAATVTIAGVGAVVLLATALPASAHAAFTSSSPEPGSQLAAAPGVVTVRFSEPLILDLSSLRVTDPDGRMWERTAAQERRMSASLDTTAQGVYVVEWKTVSPLDGHTLRGSFRFGVGVAPGEAEAALSVEPTTSDVVLAVGRAIEYGALLLALGAVAVGWLGRREPRLTWVRTRRRLATGAALTAGLVVVAGEAVLGAGPTWGAVSGYLTAEPGTPRVVRLAAEAIAVVGAAVGAGWLVMVAVTVAVAGLAASGHAAAAHPAWWAVTVDALHLLAAGLWAGGILAMGMLRPPGGWRGEAGRDLLRRFSPVAIPAFIATVAFGTLRGTQELVGIADLWRTSYGQVLVVKITAVALMVPLSWRAWRRRAARPRAESALVVAAVAAAALLAAYPVPPQRAAEDAAQARDVESEAYPQEGDLTLHGATGDMVVGLSLRPARPGRNDVLVYLLPSEGPEAAEDTTAAIRHDGEQRRLEECGIACREATMVLDGGERLEVVVSEVDDGPAVFTLPPLPAAEGGPLLEQMETAMTDLESLRYEESFGPADPPIRSTAALVAPDKLRFEVHNHDRVTIRIDDLIYRREGDGPWKVNRGPRLDVTDAYIWNYPGKTAPRLVAEEEIDGVATRVVSFFILVGDDLPTWYRLWVDGEGLVRRAEMRAQGHFMDHTYFDFNQPISIEPPPDAPSPPQEDGT